MTSPPQSITVCCPNCHLFYEDWWRPSVNHSLEDFDEQYLDEASSATCPRCLTKLRLAILENDDGVMTFNQPSWELPAASADFLSYYDQDSYLFNVVHFRYQKYKTLSAFDFFFIVIWKANRAKSKIAKKLLTHGGGYDNLEAAVQALFSDLSVAMDAKHRLRVLMEDWKFSLPMASAILTVLFPSDFSIYDYRVCESLKDFDDISFLSKFDSVWERYSAYVLAVRGTAPQYPQLRDKDRYLWGKSFADQLNSDIKASFKVAASNDSQEV